MYCLKIIIFDCILFVSISWDATVMAKQHPLHQKLLTPSTRVPTSFPRKTLFLVDLDILIDAIPSITSMSVDLLAIVEKEF